MPNHQTRANYTKGEPIEVQTWLKEDKSIWKEVLHYSYYSPKDKRRINSTLTIHSARWKRKEHRNMAEVISSLAEELKKEGYKIKVIPNKREMALNDIAKSALEIWVNKASSQ